MTVTVGYYRYTFLPTPPSTLTDSKNQAAKGINDAGQVILSDDQGGIPTASYVYSNGSYALLSGPSGATQIEAGHINNAGQIIGSYFKSGVGTVGFVEGGGVYTTPRDNARGQNFAPAAISNNGVMAGYESTGLDTILFT